jgi:hypothetical protein
LSLSESMWGGTPGTNPNQFFSIIDIVMSIYNWIDAW